MRHKPAIGLILRALIDDDDSIGGRAFSALRTIGNCEDVMQFCIDWALDSPNRVVQGTSLWTEIHAVAQRMAAHAGGQEESRAFWEPYLDSNVPTLWYYAQKAFDRPLPQAHWNWVRNAQADWNYEHERDPKVRRAIELRRRIAAIREQKDPVTNRISLEQLAEIQGLQAELKRLEAEDED
jgi:hypothetical protein